MPARGSRAFASFGAASLFAFLRARSSNKIPSNISKGEPSMKISEEFKDDLLSRGYSRRQMMRAAMMFSGAATALTLSPELAFAADAKKGAVRIGQNECWTGPMAPGAAAAAAVISQSNRYVPNNEHDDLVKTIA